MRVKSILYLIIIIIIIGAGDNMISISTQNILSTKYLYKNIVYFLKVNTTDV